MREGACSSFVDEPLPGTAAHETGWVCLEHPHGWGRDIFDGEALGADSDAIREHVAAAGLRLLLIRLPGREGQCTTRRRVFVARCLPGGTSLRTLLVGEPADLLRLDLTDPGLGRAEERPIALVCTHGRRDVCCALRGRPVAEVMSAHFGDRTVWECSHTGGHRFAPSMIVLPTGYTYGRVLPGGGVDVLEAARRGELHPVGLRGRSCWAPVGQVAEVAVRGALGGSPAARDPEALAVAVEGDDSAVVSHVDGGRWRVRMARAELPPRPASCGADAKPASAFRVTSVEVLGG